MKQSKLVIWAIIVVFIGLIIFQNQEFFLSKQILRINLGIVDVYESPQVFVAIIFVVFFIFGVIVEYLFSLPDRFRTNKMMKKLKTINTSLEKELEGLKRDVAGLKAEPNGTQPGAAEKIAEIPESFVPGKSVETPTDDTDQSFSGGAGADQSESSEDRSGESRPEADDESKKGGADDNSTDSSIAKNT